MFSMCQPCGSWLVNSGYDKNNMENQSSLKLDNGGSSLSCKFCGGMQEGDSLNQGSLLPHGAAVISPTTSLSSSNNSTLSCNDFSEKENSYDRNSQEEYTMYTSKEDTSYVTSGRVLSEAPVGIINRSHMSIPTSSTVGCDVENSTHIEIKPVKNTQESDENSVSFAGELEVLTWDLPEPDEPEADIVGSVANNDDDEEVWCGGADWGRSSSLSRIPDDGSESYKFKEEMKKLILDVVTGKLKPIVVQFLRSIGIDSSAEDGESWVDIVTSLSWEAAAFLKPDAIGGKGSGLDDHVKVKCIASGTRSESRVVRGLVFKKHAAHKHMPTQYKNPRLLLIQGVLGQSSDGLSSFDAMALGDVHLRTVIEMIETCHPNVILVEKTVSRNAQESILKKGMTLVLDMKLHRLERIALCTGSSIVSTDTSTTPKLKQCDSFYFDKFVEDHANGEGGKRPTKTLMFLEGCPKRLGCTILLMGSHSDELKAIKSVIRYSVLMAYHLILETSFLVDQRLMFSTITSLAVSNSSWHYAHSPISKSPDFCSPRLEESSSDIGSPIIDVPISDGFQNEGSQNSNRELTYSPLSYEPYNPAIFTGFSSLSASLKKVVGDSFPLASTYPSLSAYFGLTRNEPHGQRTPASAVTANSEEVGVNEIEVKDVNEGSKCYSDGHNQSSISSPKMHSKTTGKEGNVENPAKTDDKVDNVVNSESILVLMSRRNTKGIICEQSHFSRITFYRDFDIPLGKFLQNNILNQRSKCSTCGELAEAHHYYYAHHNKQLTIQVKRLLDGKRLPGEREGKLWMWSRCGRCKPENGVPKSTKRVVISSPSRVLSLGKFLELSFSQTSSSIGLSSCGHSFTRDFLHFFGLGTMVAMFRYSPVTTYTVSTPPQKLEFNYSFDSEWLMKEIDRVRTKWMMVFKEVESSLKMIKAKLEVSSLRHRRLHMDFFDIDEMLKKDYLDFEASFQNSLKNGNPGEAVYKSLNLNRLLWEMLLESYIWDQRLYSLLSLDLTEAASFSLGKAVEERSDSNVNGGSGRENSGSNGIPDKDIPIKGQDDQFATTENVVSLKVLSNQELHPRQDSILTGDHLHQNESNASLASQSSLISDLRKSNGWFWKPFHEIRQIYINDIKRGYSPRTEPLRSTAIYLPNVHQLISDEGSRLHICLSGGNADDDPLLIVSDHDGELSSIIACALALLKDQPSTKGTLIDEEEETFHNLIRNPSVSSTHLYSNGSADSGESASSRLSSFNGLALLDSLLPSEHFKAEVSMGMTKSLKGKYTVVCVYENDFRDLRRRCCPSEIDYIASLSRCRNWDAKGGKSKSFFAKTLDERLIVKEIKKAEFDSFEQFAPHYFKYMNQSFESKNQTSLAKILGIYQVIIRHPKSGKEVRHDLMVMENITYGRNITRQYDLKGALHARFNTITDGEDVLLDQNFVNDMNSSPLYVSNKAKHVLQRAVWNDTSFLNVINVMDYSLLVGVDTQKRELVCGIIDYLRQYTWDKQLETWVKSSLVPKNVLPTVISPREYKKRFRKFMSAHFLCVPDHWCSEDSSSSCQICGDDDSSSSKGN